LHETPIAFIVTGVNEGNSIPDPVDLSPDELIRYSRHLLLPEVGIEGQRRLKQARVLLVGAGGLGSPVALYLAAAGVGHLGIVDSDVVDVSNLQRQVLHGVGTVGMAKVKSAVNHLNDINPHVVVDPYPVRLTTANALALISKYDVVVDGSDNFPTRYLVNDACVLVGKPYVYGSIFRFEGQVSVFGAARGACYRCLYPEPPPPDAVPSCAEAGVLGVLPGIIGCLQANEAIKLILGIGEPLINRLLLFDALALRFRELALARDPACPLCGEQPRIRALIDYDRFCSGHSPDSTQGKRMNELTPIELKQRLDAGENVLLVDVREPYEQAIVSLPGAVSIPLGQLAARAGELDPARAVVVMCRSGGRSARAIYELRQSGYPGTLLNLKGGILAWSDQVDPSVPKY
jgi:sulfur-carrier protein adenylyltransferase/sulfurtransferase